MENFFLFAAEDYNERRTRPKPRRANADPSSLRVLQCFHSTQSIINAESARAINEGLKMKRRTREEVKKHWKWNKKQLKWALKLNLRELCSCMLRVFFLFQLSSNQSWEPSVIGPRGKRRKEEKREQANAEIAPEEIINCEKIVLLPEIRDRCGEEEFSSVGVFRKWCLWLLCHTRISHARVGVSNFSCQIRQPYRITRDHFAMEGKTFLPSPARKEVFLSP